MSLKNYLAFILVGLIIGLAVNSHLPSRKSNIETTIVEKHPLQGQTIEIGFICASNDALWFTEPLINEIILPDINEYSAKLGHGTEFVTKIDSADDQIAIHLEKVQSFHTMGLNVFRGGPWSSMAQGALSYVNDNDMLMVSPSSTAPILAIPNDRLYRLCPTDYLEAYVIAEMWDSWGAEAIIIFQRGDSWGDGIYNVIQGELDKRGITILERVRYASEVSEYSSYLNMIDNILEDAIKQYGKERVGVQLLSFAEEVVIVSQTPDYPFTREVIWMGAGGTGRSQMLLDDAGGLQVKLRMFSPMMTSSKSWKWKSLEDRFKALTELQADFYVATDYDALWLIALSMLETGSVEASDIDKAFSHIARNYWGASGWTDLDENGDRKAGGVFEIYGFTDDGFQIWGHCDGLEMKVNWYDNLLTDANITRPGVY
jgi:branched-chain amino acid transport system substrate-binding protein